MAGHILASAAIGLLVRQISVEAAGYAGGWRRTPSFRWPAHLAGQAGILGLVVFLIVFAAARLTRGIGGFDLIVTAGLCLLIVLFSIIEIMATEWSLARDDTVQHRVLIFGDLDEWCDRRLGIWWVARFIGPVLVALMGLWLAKPFAFFYPVGIYPFRAYASVAEALNWNWPGENRRRALVARRLELKASRDYQLLHSRNWWIEIWTLPVLLCALVTPYGWPGAPFRDLRRS